ncbi:hypothetical protein [Bacteroides sp.]|uniref:hypothetical protein n=1 Tax=Bacteroides sp. TaxID=29523 RepID=UPI002615818C|nr:hypothetical protein [Bacteroides sp.]MDD3038295.1 hypothetical protein [Bacteroides sp.]
MTGKRIKNLSYAIVFVCGILATFFIYSCSNDDYYADETEVGANGVAKTRAFSSRMMNGEYTLIDSIAASNEFWEFEMSNELLAEKLKAYTSTLSEEEYDQHMSSINNDDYMADLIQKANMNEVLQQVDQAREKLFNQTGFLRLSEEERTQLFTLFAESRSQIKTNSLKTRQEGGGNTSECEKQREATKDAAKLKFDNATATCGNFPAVAQLCYMNAASIYNFETRMADKAYQECIGN